MTTVEDRIAEPGDGRSIVPAPGDVYGAMAATFAAIEEVTRRDVRAGSQQFKALKIDDVYRMVRAAMAANGLVPRVRVVKRSSDTRNASQGTVIYREDIDALVIFVARDGSEFETGPWPARGEDSQDKSFTKAISYAVKTAVIATFMVPGAVEDPDENGPGESRAGDRQAGRSRGRQQQPGPSLPAGWTDRETFEHDVRVLWERAQALTSAQRGDVENMFKRLDMDWRTLTRQQAATLDGAIAQYEQPPASADEDTGEHDDGHGPSGDHDHGEVGDDIVVATVGIEFDGDGDHFHPGAQRESDGDWNKPSPPDEPPF